jgi:NADH-quinone oxidoreductase subunit L
VLCSSDRVSHSSSTAARTGTPFALRSCASFYVDRFYDNFLVPVFQNTVAAILHFFDELIINGLLVGGLSRGAASIGQVCRAIQSGKLQYYAFAVGLGVILVVYFTVFY